MSLVLTSLRRIDIVLITSALGMIVALAWLYLYFLAREMDAMDAGAMSSM